MALKRRTIAARDGRALEIELAGPEEGQLVVQHHGTPSAGRLFAPDVQAGEQRGLRHVTYSRPGYADSDRSAGRSVADCVADVDAILDALGVEQAYVVGASGGGPHALACAALLPARVLAAATMGSPAPADAEGLDWGAGMGAENLEEFATAREGEGPLLAYLERQLSELAQAASSDIRDALGGLLSEVDHAALTGALADHLAMSTGEALARGLSGWVDDDLAFVRHWGFELADIARPVAVWYGAHDRFVPPAHGEWLARHIPTARAEPREQHGHLSLIGAYGEVLDLLIGPPD